MDLGVIGGDWEQDLKSIRSVALSVALLLFLLVILWSCYLLGYWLA